MKLAQIAFSLQRLPEATTREVMHAEYALLSKRRSVRHFSTDPVPQEVI